MNKVRLLFLFFLFIGIANWLQAQTVYVTRTGSKYHEGSCRYLRQSKIAISLAKAKANGYTACSVCRPPEQAVEKESSSPIQNNPSATNDGIAYEILPSSGSSSNSGYPTTSSCECSNKTKAPCSGSCCKWGTGTGENK